MPHIPSAVGLENIDPLHRFKSSGLREIRKIKNKIKGENQAHLSLAMRGRCAVLHGMRCAGGVLCCTGCDARAVCCAAQDAMRGRCAVLHGMRCAGGVLCCAGGAMLLTMVFSR